MNNLESTFRHCVSNVLVAMSEGAFKTVISFSTIRQWAMLSPLDYIAIEH